MIGAPWSVDVELTEGCNRYCSFCGLQAIRPGTGGYKRMSLTTAKMVAGQLGVLAPRTRVEFAGHGEPLMNGQFVEIFSLFRARLPEAQLQVTTNGAPMRNGRMRQVLEDVFAAGINIVMLDTYAPERDGLREQAFALPPSIEVIDFYEAPDRQAVSPWVHYHGKVNRRVVLMDDLELRDGELAVRKIDNRAGNNPNGTRVTEPLRKTCVRPFRTMVVTWQGNVIICCEDWKQEYVAGNVHEVALMHIWRGAEMEAARAHLQNKDRSLRPCSTCDAAAGPRAGLLPKYAPLDEATRSVVRRVLAKGAGGS